ncbi:MAG TPA: hypothetical protein VL263_17925 [Vicinamibacterales bacterium]|nr:hypothetical protein [Vicinamibacterales bacterium]
MIRRPLVLAIGTVLVVAACSKKPDAPAGGPAPATPPPATPATPSTAPAGTAAAGQGHNTGTPIDGDATVTAPATVTAGGEVEVAWTGPGNTADYIDLVPRSRVEAGGESGYVYTKDAMPVARLTAPTAPGDYAVRYVADLGSGRKVKAVAPVTVSAATATVTATPKAESAEAITVAWTGPSGQGDYVDIARAETKTPDSELTYVYAKEGSPAHLVAPAAAGSYQVRYLLEGPGGKKVLASTPLEVTLPVVTLEAPEKVAPSAPFTVAWTGPQRKGDYIDLVKGGHTATSGELTYFYAVKDTNSSLTAPAQGGAYEIRYVLEGPGGRVVLGRRAITVQ